MMLVIFGPTVSGKTNLAIKLAKRLNGQVISADSRQIYESLDIGTGKIPYNSSFEKHKNYWLVEGVRINGFDIKKPNTSFSSVDFKNFASPIIEKLESQSILPIVTGGSGFYIKSLLSNNSTFGIDKDIKLRKSLEKKSAEQLFKDLLKINSKKALALNESDKKNPRRLIRAIEVTLNKNQNKKISILPLSKETFIIGLSAPNEYLFNKADQWLEQRLKNGLVREVDSLLKNQVKPQWLDSLGLEYRWITRYLLGKIDKNTAIERLSGDIHNLIRKQKTFMSQFDQIRIFDVSKEQWEEDLALELNNQQLIMSKLKNSGRE